MYISVYLYIYMNLVGVHNTEYAVRSEDITPFSASTPSRPPPSLSAPSPLASMNPLQTEARLSNNVLKSHSSVNAAAAAAQSSLKTRRLEVSRVVGPDSYQIGIIDFQQQWNFNKKVSEL
jgi:hypothetical protein